jgi:methylated-DNA-[protein]-cysteine S-methyltransferase
MKNLNTDRQWMMASPIGKLYLMASDKGLKGIFFKKQSGPVEKSLDLKIPAHKILQQSVRELEEYFLAKRKNFTVALDFDGTDFQKQVWSQLLRIPYGKTLSYKEVAKGIRNPKAVRAVGSANGKNPLCIIVPCHRVIAADGTLGGYSAGIANKQKLLDLEKALVASV